MSTLIVTLPLPPGGNAPEYGWLLSPDGQGMGEHGSATASLLPQPSGAGAEVVAVVPASWAPGERKVEQWRALAVARALDSTCFVVAVDQAEPPDDPDAAPGARRPTGVGHSMVVGPLGEILLELDAEPRLVLTDVNLDDVRTARATLPVLANSRFDSTLRAQ